MASTKRDIRPNQPKNIINSKAIGLFIGKKRKFINIMISKYPKELKNIGIVYNSMVRLTYFPNVSSKRRKNISEHIDKEILRCNQLVAEKINKKLLVDIPGILDRLIPIQSRKMNYLNISDIKIIQKNIRDLEKFCKLSGYQLIGFLQMNNQQDEWRTKQLKLINPKQKYSIMNLYDQGWLQIIVNIFEKLEIKVISPNEKFYESIIKYAISNNGTLLTTDPEFCYFNKKDVEIYVGYMIHRKNIKIKFLKRQYKIKRDKIRFLNDDNPDNTSCINNYSPLIPLNINGNYTCCRGTPCKSVFTYGNPYGLFLEAFSAIFEYFGFYDMVTFSYPTMESNQVIWKKCLIEPEYSDEMEDLLANPVALIKQYGNLKDQPKDYQQAVRVIAYQISAMYLEKSLLDIFLEEEAKLKN